MTWKRVATAAVLMPAVILAVLWGSNLVVAIAVAAITELALWEFFALGEAIGHRAYRFWTLFCAILLIHAQWASGRRPEFLFNLGERVFWLKPSIEGVFLFFVLGLTVLTLWTRRPLVESLPAAGISSSALLLVAFPFSFSVRLHGLFNVGSKLLLFALAITWAADTFAYFVGRAFGKHPLAPHISPKKTWEGSVGGMVGSLLVAWGFSYWIPMPLAWLIPAAIVGNIAGQMGDLLESACKRSAGVKDSGGLLPGHGGILDRIDALILCIPVVWYYLVLVNPPIQ